MSPEESALLTHERDLYLARFPDSAQTFALGDFNLYKLYFRDGRFVAGFGKAYNLTLDTLRRLNA